MRAATNASIARLCSAASRVTFSPPTPSHAPFPSAASTCSRASRSHRLARKRQSSGASARSRTAGVAPGFEPVTSASSRDAFANTRIPSRAASIAGP